MSRNRALAVKVRGVSSKYDGRPSLCGDEPGGKQCLEKLHSTSHSLCVNCKAEGSKTERIRFFGQQH